MEKFMSNDAAEWHRRRIAEKDERIAELEREVAAITSQRDRVWTQLLDARAEIQRLTFGRSGN